jgi:hypothetical protein
MRKLGAAAAVGCKGQRGTFDHFRSTQLFAHADQRTTYLLKMANRSRAAVSLAVMTAHRVGLYRVWHGKTARNFVFSLGRTPLGCALLKGMCVTRRRHMAAGSWQMEPHLTCSSRQPTPAPSFIRTKTSSALYMAKPKPSSSACFVHRTCSCSPTVLPSPRQADSFSFSPFLLRPIFCT